MRGDDLMKSMGLSFLARHRRRRMSRPRCQAINPNAATRPTDDVACDDAPHLTADGLDNRDTPHITHPDPAKRRPGQTGREQLSSDDTMRHR